MAKKKKTVRKSKTKNRKKIKKKSNIKGGKFDYKRKETKDDLLFTLLRHGIISYRERVIKNLLPYKDHITIFGEYYEFNKKVYEYLSSRIKVGQKWINSNEFHVSIMFSMSKSLSALTLTSHAGLMNSSTALLYRKAYECAIIMHLDIKGLITNDAKEIYLNRYLKETFDATKEFNQDIMGEVIEDAILEGKRIYDEKLKSFCRTDNLKGVHKSRNNWTIGMKGSKTLRFKDLAKLLNFESHLVEEWKKLSNLGHNNDVCEWENFDRNKYIKWPTETMREYYEINNLKIDFSENILPIGLPDDNELLYNTALQETGSVAIAELAGFTDSAYLLWSILDLLNKTASSVLDPTLMATFTDLMKSTSFAYEMGYKNASVTYFRNIVHFIYSKVLDEKKNEDENDSQYFERVSQSHIDMEWHINGKKVKFWKHLLVLINESNSYVHPTSYEVFSEYSIQDKVMEGFLFFPLYLLADIISKKSKKKSLEYKSIILMADSLRSDKINKKTIIKYQ